MMRIAICAICFVVFATGTGDATPVEWSAAIGGNGHWYEAVLISEGITWLDSKLAAEQSGGYLATLTSEAENNFVFSLVKDMPEFWWWQGGPWMGGYQDQNDPDYAEPLGGWKWVSGEPWSYTNWMKGEPSGAGQDCLHFAGYDLTIAPTWDDAGALSGTHVEQPYRGYIVEWGAVPEPASLLALICGLGGAGSMLLRNRRRK
ncbi:MAG: PEP-CTERM sorting domain-containing protein [Armatimonadetes bacterium]|nr:PEP-CTERM sorting domain-containing protein [Armatimonadota bacterium]